MGHSMGGIVARMMPLLENYRNGTIQDIITLSTPHREVALPLQRDMHKMMQQLNQDWILLHGKENSVLEDVTLTSIAGGNRDTVLDSAIVDLTTIANKSLSNFYFSSGMSGIWSSGDHEATTWCNQLLQQLSKLTFELYERQGNSLQRMRVIRNLLDPKSRLTSKKETFTTEEIDAQVEYSRVQLLGLKTEVGESRRYMMSLPIKQRERYHIRMISTLLNNQFELLLCRKEMLVFKCRQISPKLKPLLEKNFKIKLWHHDDPESANRKTLSALDYNLNNTNFEQLIFEIKSNSTGDFIVTIDHEILFTKTYNTWKSSTFFDRFVRYRMGHNPS